jgi:hypothetical protein
MNTKTTSRLASGTETEESPFQWVLASDLRENEALASGLVITKLDITNELVVADFNDDTSWQWPALDIVLIKRRDTTPAEAKLEHTLRSAVAKRPGWNMGTSSRRGTFVATRHEGEFSAYVGNGTDGIWCWAVLRNGVLCDHGQVPAGPTANMRAAERVIAAWQSAVTR